MLDFRNGAWQSRPETMLFACLGPDGAPAKQTTTQVIWLQQSHGALRGTMTVTVESNECSQQGATIETPVVAAHVMPRYSRGSRCSARRATLHVCRRRRRTPG